MGDDRTFATPPRRPARVGRFVLVAVIAFAVGAGALALVLHERGGWLARWRTPAVVAAAPSGAPTPSVDLATLAARETALAAQLAALEARSAALGASATAAGGQAARAESLLVVFAARRSLDRGLALGYLEEQLRQRLGTAAPQEVATVTAASRRPVTLEDLRESLSAAAPTLLAGRSDWWAGVGSELRNLVVIHRAGTPSPLPADRLDRARRMIAAGNVEAATAEVARLPGADNAAAWLDAARRYVAARRALDRLEAVALAGPAVVPAAPAPATAVVDPEAGAPDNAASAAGPRAGLR